MQIPIASDLQTQLTTAVADWLAAKGYEPIPYGALLGGSTPWPTVGHEIASLVGAGQFQQAILFCWTGTGISIAANKVPGVRAALCWDAETARGAKKWNDANILCLSLRYTSEAVAKEILEAWFSTEASADADDQACLRMLEAMEKRP
ncbi:MAG TPA: RpiB/LacA/LacB family sugar-phosphate isomerase [Saprospiraceae bacterium]|nr:RpiB/LacA/LacB family sugar-phosphate isomerase [Saprospiraceae bacterium]HMQ81530.1 RpiB/LacA/LacB family sugar-phosphate isomerase [Saprospiraceae bacterium]